MSVSPFPSIFLRPDHAASPPAGPGSLVHRKNPIKVKKNVLIDYYFPKPNNAELEGKSGFDQ